MRRAALLLLLASCVLDPTGVLDRVALRVKAFGLPAGGKLRLVTVDSRAVAREKNTPVTAEEMQILYEEGSLAAGAVVLSAEVFDSSMVLVGCGTARGVVGDDDTVVIGFASPSTSAVNCGTCGNRCETDVSTGSCVGGKCTAWECAPGFVSDGDGGCSMMVMMPPDAGPQDAGVACMPAAEDSDVACSNGADDNCDLRVDCADPGCAGLMRACTMTAGCMGPGVQAWDCAARTWGACEGNQASENTIAACSDNVDNDCDGKTDCADEGCQDIKEPCPGGICAAGVKLWNCSTHLFGLCLPYIPLAENTGLLCGNSLDDDCDGKTDCGDVSCRGRVCASGRICCADGGCAASCN